MNEHTITVRIYWDDLSKEMQQKLLRVFGDNGNWDCIPVTTFEIHNDPEYSICPGKDIVIDSFLGDEGL